MDVSYTVTLIGTDEARCGTIRISGGKGGPIGRLAREMQKQGLEPGMMDIRRDGTQVFARNMSVEWWAGKSTSEPNAGSVKLSQYAPDPRFSPEVV